LRPHYPQVQIALSDIYLRLQRPQRALATLDSLAEAYPPGAVPQTVLALRGISLKQLGRYGAAVDALTEATSGEHASGELLYELAEAQWLAGNAASAKVAVQAALAQSPNHHRALHLRDQIQLASSKLHQSTAR
jgi:hypothetical protein